MLGAITLFSSCSIDPVSTSVEGKGMVVDFLFEKDGIKVYRFKDGNCFHYFTSTGETINTAGGKNSQTENINGTLNTP